MEAYPWRAGLEFPQGFFLGVDDGNIQPWIRAGTLMDGQSRRANWNGPSERPCFWPRKWVQYGAMGP